MCALKGKIKLLRKKLPSSQGRKVLEVFLSAWCEARAKVSK